LVFKGEPAANHSARRLLCNVCIHGLSKERVVGGGGKKGGGQKAGSRSRAEVEQKVEDDLRWAATCVRLFCTWHARGKAAKKRKFGDRGST
jgi:hypothetical protein